MSAYIKKTERSQVNDLKIHLKLLEKEEQANPKTNRRREIIKIRAEINDENMQILIILIWSLSIVCMCHIFVSSKYAQSLRVNTETYTNSKKENCICNQKSS
jgi:hypothetical protein